MSINISEWVHILWYIQQWGILLSNKKDCTTDINNIDESQNNYDEQKKPDRKEYILYDSVYVNSINKKQIIHCLEKGG